MRLLTGILTILVLVLLYGCSEEKSQPKTGRELYEYYCAACHGESGAGQFLRGIPPLIQNKFLKTLPLTPSQVKHKIQGSEQPGRKMPSFTNISDNEARLIAHYIRELNQAP